MDQHLFCQGNLHTTVSRTVALTDTAHILGVIRFNQVLLVSVLTSVASREYTKHSMAIPSKVTIKMNVVTIVSSATPISMMISFSFDFIDKDYTG
jgi:hypothetical protein